MKKLLLFMGIFVLILPLMFLGCDDGDDGAQGPPGEDGQDAVSVATPESCAVCHSSVEAIHEATDVATVSDVVVDNNASIAVTFTIAVDGVLDDSFTLRRAYVHYDNAALQTTPPTLVTTFVRVQLYRVGTVNEGVTITPPVNGEYTITFLDNVVVPDSNYLIQMQSATSDERPVVVIQNGVEHLRDLVTDTGCASCHGPFPAWSEKFSHYAVGGSECQMCHSRATRQTAFISKDDAGAFVVTDNVLGTNLTEYIHGIHNSHNMPDGVYYRTTAPDDDFDEEDRYSIGFPSDMRNCAVCHTDRSPDGQLETVAAAPVSYYLCMTCHNNWDGFVHLHDAEDGSYEAGDPIFSDTSFHRNYTVGQNCMLNCHASLPDKNDAGDFHNDIIQPPDSHADAFYRGTDISFDNANDVTFAITGVTKTGDNVAFTWTASRLGAAVDPCNTDTAAGPVYSDLGAYLAYAKGDDWVNENVRDAPGQPLGAEDLFGDLTTVCDNTTNVATTTGLTIAPGTTYAEKALLAVGGKPIDQDTFTIGAVDTDLPFFVREPSPTYAFSMADGSAVAPRRDAVDSLKCLACHRGTLYQHGGDRVDNEQLCVICHNPSASDLNNRLDRYQIINPDGTVNTDATYDGKINETYDMRTMVHGIHGVNKRQNTWVLYRGRGIYGFAEAGTPLPTGWPGEGDNNAVYGSTNGSTMVHNWIVVHYPKPANECMACHNEEAYEAVDQTKAVAMTTHPGTDYADQSDDIVRGPTAAACTACHNNVEVQVHATDFGYWTQVTKDEMLDKAAQ